MSCKTCFVFLFLLSVIISGQTSLVRTEYGLVKGQLLSGAHEFLGIPFAAPPTGDLRWKEPVPPGSWNDTLLTQAFKPICSQKDFGTGGDTNYSLRGSEDCLYLNVWSPNLDSLAGLPVLVFIHGGGNQQGGAGDTGGGTQMYLGRNLSSRGNAVVVTLQYRLGPLGFLVHPGLEAENSRHISGNYGVFDQILALKWVKRNIRRFGGDTTKTMLFGESAGGLNTGNLLTSPLAAGLFTRAGIQSACPKLAPRDSAMAAGIAFVDTFALSGTDPQKISALRALPADSLIAKVKNNNSGGSIQHNWQPSVDGHVFPGLPEAIVSAGLHHKMPLLIGSNADELSIAVPKVVTPSMIPLLFLRVPEPFREQGLTLYPPGTTNAEAHESYVQILCDGQFTATTRRTARAVASHQPEPVWRYFFSHTQVLVAKYGAYHGEELFYIFNTWENSPLATGRFFTPQDDSVQRHMLKYWVNFARTGNPNSDSLAAWPVYSAATDCYLEIKATPDGGQCGLRTAKCDYWDTVTAATAGISRETAAMNPADLFTLTASPNPFNTAVTLWLIGPSGTPFKPGRDRLGVYDLGGRLVADLTRQAESRELIWNTGRQPAGCYFVNGNWNSLKFQKRLILLK